MRLQLLPHCSRGVIAIRRCSIAGGTMQRRDGVSGSSPGTGKSRPEYPGGWRRVRSGAHRFAAARGNGTRRRTSGRPSGGGRPVRHRRPRNRPAPGAGKAVVDTGIRLTGVQLLDVRLWRRLSHAGAHWRARRFSSWRVWAAPSSRARRMARRASPTAGPAGTPSRSRSVPRSSGDTDCHSAR